MRSIATALCLLASVSLAQKSEPAPKAQQVDFTGSNIGAERATPLGEIYLAHPKKKFDCRIQVRMNFNDKLRESVHEM